MAKLILCFMCGEVLLPGFHSRRTPVSPIRSWGVIVLLLTISGQPLLLAQSPISETPPASAVAPAAKPSPAPIGSGDIPNRLAEAAALLRTVSDQTDTDELEGDVGNRLKALRPGVDQLAMITDRHLASSPPLTDIRDLQSFWRENLTLFSGWSVRVSARTRDLERHIDDLLFQQQEWLLTEEDARERGFDPRTVARINVTASSLADAGQQIRDARNRMLDLQTDVTDVLIQTNEALDGLRVAANSGRFRLLTVDRPPIWKVLNEQSVAPETLSSELIKTSAIQPLVSTYLMRLGSGIVMQSGIFIGLVALLLLVRQSAPDFGNDGDPGIRTLGVAMKRPYSAALLAAVFAGGLIYVDVPSIFSNAAWLLLLIPLLRLLPGIVPAALRRPYYGLALLYGADRTLSLMPENWMVSRLAYFALSLIAIVFLLWAVRLLRNRPKQSAWRPFVIFGIQSCAGVAIGVAVCEVIGALSLSRFLMDGLLRTLYGAILTFAAVLIFRGGLRLAMRSSRFQTLTDHQAISSKSSQVEQMLTVIGLISFATLTLRTFSVLDPVIDSLRKVWTTVISIGEIDIVVGDLFTFLIVVLASTIISRVLRFFLHVGVYPKVGLHKGVAESISKILHYMVVLFGVLVAFSAAGVEMSRFTVLAGAFGVGLAFGLQTIVNNFVSGLILLVERPIQVGDNVTVGSVAGLVTDIGIRATSVRTWDGADVIIPNGNLIANDLTNWTLSDVWRRVDLTVGVAYGTDPEEVMTILADLANSHPKVADHQPVTTLFVGFGESSLEFLLRYWTRVEDFVAVNSEMHVWVCRAFKENGIEIPFPQRDLNLRRVDDQAGAALRSDAKSVGVSVP